jgi:cell division protein FtsB
MAQTGSASAQRAAARRRLNAAQAKARRSGWQAKTRRSGWRPGTGRSGIRWDRVARAALLGTLGVVLLLYISPLHRWITQRQLAGQQTQELHVLQKQNRQLRSHIKRLHDPAALEAEARKLGMVRRGEREYVIENLPAR